MLDKYFAQDRIYDANDKRFMAADPVQDEVTNKSKTLFRGERSSATPDKVFKEGFTPKGSSNDLLSHTRSNTTPGNFVSTSAEKKIAQEFAGKNGYVYEITTSKYIDVNKALGVKSPFPEQLEFAIPSKVSPSQIKGAWQIKSWKFVGEYIVNPRYKGW